MNPAGTVGEEEGSVTAPRPSTVKLPADRPAGVVTVLDYFLRRFPRIPEETWRARFRAGKVWSDGEVVTEVTSFRPLWEVHYRREVQEEPPVRRDFRIVWEDEDLVVVDKPPNLPVTPGGNWVRNCLLHLLSVDTGNWELAPLHRLDRLTSGLVLFSKRRRTRSHYSRLFQPSAPVEKTYTAVCEVVREPVPEGALLKHHIARSPEEYWRQIVVPDLPPNAVCRIELLERAGSLALYRIRPTTGRKHQIRVQLAEVGLPISGDPLYGTRPDHDPGDLTRRMWLDAHGLAVRDFRRPGGLEPLTLEWFSSRPPGEMLRGAMGDPRR